MLHFSCDLCGHHLGDERFVVKLEVFPAFDPDELTEDDLDSDHLQEISELIEEAEANGRDATSEVTNSSFRFDLCPRCHQRFLKDPLGRDALRRLNFSEN